MAPTPHSVFHLIWACSATGLSRQTYFHSPQDAQELPNPRVAARTRYSLQQESIKIRIVIPNGGCAFSPTQDFVAASATRILNLLFLHEP
jgi:hypothetical protein